MAAVKGHLTGIIFLWACCPYCAEALTCYTCDSISTDSGSAVVSDLISGSSNPGCENLEMDETSANCPDDYGYKCASITAKVSLFGDLGRMSVTTRGCVKTSESNGCYTGNKYVKDGLNLLLSLATETAIAGVDGEICYCDTDLCDAKCGKNTFSVGSICMPYWATALTGIAILVILSLCCTCCCCCCCRPCRSRKPYNVVVVPPATGGQVVMTTTTTHTDGSVSATNPGYMAEPKIV